MQPAGRLGDKSKVPADAHGCPSCPHDATGPATIGSSNVIINNRPALRVGDSGIHSTCCAANTWKAVAGAKTVFINGQSVHRKDDVVQHCGGTGKLIEGSSNVFIGDWSGVGKNGNNWVGFLALSLGGEPLSDIDVTLEGITSNSRHFLKSKEDGRAKKPNVQDEHYLVYSIDYIIFGDL